MATLKIELNDELYKDLKDSNINVQEKIKDYLQNLLDDGYPAISTSKAKKRVEDAVNRYRVGRDGYSIFDDNSMQKMEKYIQSLWLWRL